MLVLTRRKKEAIRIGDDIKITIVELSKSQIEIGIESPEKVRIKREDNGPKNHGKYRGK